MEVTSHEPSSATYLIKIILHLLHRLALIFTGEKSMLKKKKKKESVGNSCLSPVSTALGGNDLVASRKETPLLIFNAHLLAPREN